MPFAVAVEEDHPCACADSHRDNAQVYRDLAQVRKKIDGLLR
jgi:hypothetical protein